MSLKILYIAGSSRSGSTILDNILGQLDGFFSMGEARLLWRRTVENSSLCSCREAFTDCRVWGPVIDDLIPDPPARLKGMEELADRWAVTTRAINYPSLLFAHSKGKEPPACRELSQQISQLYRSVQRHTGARVIVDSSKMPFYGVLAEAAPGIDFHVVHLLRDPRAVLYSWRRRKVHSDTSLPMPDDQGYAIRQWIAWNLIASWHWRKSVRYLRVRYESFAAEPMETVKAVLSSIGEPVSELPFEGANVVRIGEHHTIPGNPIRFQTGRVEIRPDLEWRQRMPRFDKAVVTALTWPLLLKYGYSVI